MAPKIIKLSQTDSSARHSTDEMIQFVYVGDGLDLTSMKVTDRPMNFRGALDNIKAASPYAHEDLVN